MKKRKIETSPGCSSNCFLTIFIISLLIFIFQAIFIFGGFFKDYRDIIANVFIVLLSSLCLVSVILLYKKIPINFPKEKKGMLFLAFAMALFLIGDLLWLASEVFFGDLTPIGSFPDLAWNFAYFALIFSLIYFVLLSFRPSKFITYSILLVALIMGGGILYEDVHEDFEEGSFTFSHFIQDLYILYDLVALFLVVYLVWPIAFSGTRFGQYWTLLGLGIITRLGYDRIFADMSQKGTYYSSHPVDLLYVAVYLIAVLSFYIKSRDFEVKI
jgi:hypothetical protein